MAANSSILIAAEYRDPKEVFTITYDDALWSIEDEADNDFAISCDGNACRGIRVGCTGNKGWVPFGRVSWLIDSFDPKDTERAQLDTFRKASADKEAKDKDRPADAPPEVVQSYIRRDFDGHPAFEAQFRVTMAGQTTRYMSFSTAARNYSIAIVCYAPEEKFEEWRGRFEALMQGFKPIQRRGWRAILDLIGF